MEEKEDFGQRNKEKGWREGGGLNSSTLALVV